ncbi:MAG: hypothetical protein HYU97_10470 [Deltaproteobacteria bacterium]|nr:hypothetical protein [Deltaproteobacteria bacterium]
MAKPRGVTSDPNRGREEIDKLRVEGRLASVALAAQQGGVAPKPIDAARAVRGLSELGALEAAPVRGIYGESLVATVAREEGSFHGMAEGVRVAVATPENQPFARWVDRLLVDSERLSFGQIIQRLHDLLVDTQHNMDARQQGLHNITRDFKLLRHLLIQLWRSHQTYEVPSRDTIQSQLERYAELGLIKTEEVPLILACLDFPKGEEKIRQALAAAEGNISKDIVGSYNVMQGLLFELTNLRYMAEFFDAMAIGIDAQGSTQVTYRGLDVRNQWTELSSPIDNDLALIPDHIWEHKRYSRYGVGETRQVRNQILKYQAAIEQGLYQGASVELTGRFDPTFLAFAEKYAPNIEILYSLELSEHHRVVFPIKEARNSTRSLRRIQPKVTDAKRDLTEDERLILKGLQRAIEQGRITAIFVDTVLDVADVQNSPYRDVINKAKFDPKKIHDLNAYREYENLLHQKRLNLLKAIAEQKTNDFSSEFQYVEITDHLIDTEFRRFEHYFAHEAPEAMRGRFNLPDELRARAHDEYAKRRREVAEIESSRLAADDSFTEARAAKGYQGPATGFPLIPLHIYFDVVKSVLKGDKPPGSRHHAKKRVEKVPWQRDYHCAENFPTAEHLAAEVRTGVYQDQTRKVIVYYPAGSSELRAVHREYEIESVSKFKKLEQEILDKNLKILQELGQSGDVARKVKRGLEINRRRIQSAWDHLTNLRQQKTDRLRDLPIAERAQASIAFDEKIAQAKQGILDLYREVIGADSYRQLTARITHEEWNNIRKFIYTVGFDNVMRVYEEAIEPGYERPAHSILAGGLNVYAAGEFYLQNNKIISLNNGSGHYHPDATMSLEYTKNLLAEAGFDVSNTRLEHILHPYVSIDVPVETYWQNDFLNIPSP